MHTIKRKKTYFIGHILCRKCRLKHIIEGKIGQSELRGRQGRKCKQQLNDLRKQTRNYWEFIALCGLELVLEEAMDLSSGRLWNEFITYIFKEKEGGGH